MKVFLIVLSIGFLSISYAQSDSTVLISFVNDLRACDLNASEANASKVYNKYFCLDNVPVKDTVGHKENNIEELHRLKTLLNIYPVVKVYPYDVHKKLYKNFAILPGHPHNTYSIDFFSEAGKLHHCGFAYILNGKIISIRKRAGRYQYKEWM